MKKKTYIALCSTAESIVNFLCQDFLTRHHFFHLVHSVSKKRSLYFFHLLSGGNVRAAQATVRHSRLVRTQTFLRGFSGLAGLVVNVTKLINFCFMRQNIFMGRSP